MRRSDLLAVAFAILAGAASAGPSERVVSINLCTDQLAMLLAAPGQLLSVSHLAADPLSSSMVETARGYRQNRGGAEQVYLMQPDLVLAGTYTAQETVGLLRRLGIEVVQVPPATSLAEAVGQIRQIGAALGQEARAETMAAAVEAGIAALDVPEKPATAAMYYPNGYTTGAGTLADDVLRVTGFRNIGSEAGLTGGGVLPLERLVMAAPQVIVTSTPYPGASRSEEILRHPALAALRTAARETRASDADWVCGTPHILRAVNAMAAIRRSLEGQR